MSRRRGFTLIELLVVIAIIGDFDRPALAGRAEGARSPPPEPVHQQSQADRSRPAQLSRHQQFVSSWLHRRQNKPQQYSRQRHGAGLGLGGLVVALHGAAEPLQPDQFQPGSRGGNNVAMVSTQLKMYQCPSDGYQQNSFHEEFGSPIGTVAHGNYVGATAGRNVLQRRSGNPNLARGPDGSRIGYSTSTRCSRPWASLSKQ